MRSKLGIQLLAPLLALLVAIVVSAIILKATGNSPIEVLKVIRDSGFKQKTVVETLNRSAPYYISAVAVAIGFKMNLFNIGVEGQYRFAALLAAWAGGAVAFPAFIHVPFILIVGMLAGAAYAAIPAVLKATRGVSEVISSIMLNSIVFGLNSWLLVRFFADKSRGSGITATKHIKASGLLPSLDAPLAKIGIHLPSTVYLQSYIFVALLVGLAYWFLVWRTRFGFDLRATGSNPEAAQASGVDPKAMIYKVMLLSGAIAGLVGLSLVMSTGGQYDETTVVRGLGFSGIAIALLGRNHPVGIAVGALLWSFMDAIQTPLSAAGLPKQIVPILQAITVISVVIAYEIVRRVESRREAASLRRGAAGGDPPPLQHQDGNGMEVAPA